MRRDSTQSWHHERVPPWFDTHVHLDRYAPPEREALLARAEAAGVRVFAVAVDLESSAEVARLATTIPGAVGIHPRHAAAGFEDELRNLARTPGIVAIGECGFDGGGVPHWDLQERTFLAQCGIARELGKSLVLHIDGEGAWERFGSCAAAAEGLRVIRHYFTGDAAQAAWHAERGHYLSFSNPLRREPALRDIARNHPENLLLIETDSYPLPNRNTEPAHVAKIGETIAVLRDWTFDQCREQVARNTAAAFGIRTSINQ